MKWLFLSMFGLSCGVGCASDPESDTGAASGEGGSSNAGTGGEGGASATSTSAASSMGTVGSISTCKVLDGKCDPVTEDCSCTECQGTAFCNVNQCTDNGQCTVEDSCTCHDCLTDAFCSNPANCVNDGTCDSFTEGCQCADCAAMPACTGSGPISNTPQAQFVDISLDGTTGLVLKSINFVQKPSGDRTYQEWFAEIANQGTTTFCFVQLSAIYKDGANKQLAKVFGYTDAPAYTGSGTLSKPCIAPGKSGGLYNNAFADAAVSLAQITTVEYSFDFLVNGSDVPHPLAPTIVSATVKQTLGPQYFAVAGVAKNNAATAIYNIDMTVYPVNAQGLLFDQNTDVHLDTLFPKDTWSYETTSAEGAFMQFLQATAFITGERFAPPQGGAGNEAKASAPSPELELDRLRREHRELRWKNLAKYRLAP